MQQGSCRGKNDIVLIAIGSNATSLAGGAKATVEAAILALREKFNGIKASSLYRTPAFPNGAGPDFVNAALAAQSDLEAERILEILHGIEAEFGRERVQRWGQRSLDLDLIACGARVLPDLPTYRHWVELPLERQKTDAPEQLILPHPRLADRSFVLVPLAEVAPDWCHPVTQLTVRDMLDAQPKSARAEVTRLP